MSLVARQKMLAVSSLAFILWPGCFAPKWPAAPDMSARLNQLTESPPPQRPSARYSPAPVPAAASHTVPQSGSWARASAAVSAKDTATAQNVAETKIPLATPPEENQRNQAVVAEKSPLPASRPRALADIELPLDTEPELEAQVDSIPDDPGPQPASEERSAPATVSNKLRPQVGAMARSTAQSDDHRVNGDSESGMIRFRDAPEDQLPVPPASISAPSDGWQPSVDRSRRER